MTMSQERGERIASLMTITTMISSMGECSIHGVVFDFLDMHDGIYTGWPFHLIDTVRLSGLII